MNSKVHRIDSQGSEELIPVTLRRTTRHKRPQIVGVITADQLTRRYEIPRRDFQRKTGYQREVSNSRVNKMAGELRKKRVDLPTALLLNLREYDESVNLVNRNGTYFFDPNDSQLFVVDGQHRVEALRQLVEENPDEWGSFEIAFTCMLGASEQEEMEEFYVVNSTAKSVRTDLALDLLKQRAEKDPSVMESLLERGEQWKVEAQAVSEEMARLPVWQGRIRFVGASKAATTIGTTAIVSSLNQPMANHYFSAIQRGHRLQILDAFWRAIKVILPEAFDDPTEFALQKTTGVQTLHRVLIPVLEILRSTGKSVIDPESYVAVLRDSLLELEGDTAAGGVAKGVEFWRSGPDGAAGSFSSNAGQRVLVARIKSGLPSPEVA